MYDVRHVVKYDKVTYVNSVSYDGSILCQNEYIRIFTKISLILTIIGTSELQNLKLNMVINLI